MGIKELSAAIDAASVLTLKDKRRGHLGPSTLSGSCTRSMYYDFRWASPEENHTGDMARLLSRGHDEEHKIYQWLRAAGIEVRDYTQRLLYCASREEVGSQYQCVDWDMDWRTFFDWYEDVSNDPVHIKAAVALDMGPKQWGFTAHGGHHSGSSDGLLQGVDKWLPEAVGWGLAECKTSSEKNFTPLAGPKGKWIFSENRFEPRAFNPKIHGIQNAKPDHYRQMQEYMRQLGVSWGLYMVVNKNTDEIYYEFVPLMAEVGDQLYETAEKIIYASSPPPKRYSDPSSFECKVCQHQGICHYQEPLAVNCRSCVFSAPSDGGQWYCLKFDQIIPKDFVPQGCQKWEPLV